MAIQKRRFSNFFNERIFQMNNTINIDNLLDKRAIDITAGELADVILAKLRNEQPAKEKTLVKGITGIMEIFKCGRSKATQLRASGILNPAITTTGRIFLIDVDMALDLVSKKKKGGRR